ncbi:demethylmenaquinone methyltransferase [Mariniluteicoccus flavus]
MPKSDYRATLAKRRADVAEMFDGVARRYDLMNGLMTGGLHLAWRRATVHAVDANRGEKVLDLAAGTGVSTQPFADAGALAVPCDLSMGMLRVGKERLPHLPFVQADALNLPFADDAFDAVTISYGLRNFEHTVEALAEIRRVTRPGGRIVINEFSTPVIPLSAPVYKNVILAAIPALARAAASNPSAYIYLADSIRTWHDQPTLAGLMVEAGWRGVEWRNLSAGIVALHRAVA